MTTLKRPRDPNQLAKFIVDMATGEADDRELTPAEQGKDAAAADLGRRGGMKGGRARAALHFMYYNFVRLHAKLRVSPAMAAGVTDRLWEISDIVSLVEASEPANTKRGPYKKKSPDA